MLTTVEEEAITRIRLDSPSTKNLLDTEMTRALIGALRSASGRVILLEAGGPIFCSGDSRPEQLPELLRFRRWVGCPVVVAVQGPAAGAGVALLANANLVVAAQGVSFALTEIREGRWPEEGWDALAGALGLRRLQALALTGRVFTAPEALAWGLVHELAPAFELDDRAWATAKHLAGLNEEALKMMMRTG